MTRMAATNHPSPRRLASLVVAILLVLSTAAPALGYGNVNREHIRLQRLDPVLCATPIAIDAFVRTRPGTPAAGVTVTFFLSNGRAGDVLGPTNSITNAQGHAGTSLTMSCIKGPRTVRASVESGARASITFVCNANEDCEIQHVLQGGLRRP